MPTSLDMLARICRFTYEMVASNNSQTQNQSQIFEQLSQMAKIFYHFETSQKVKYEDLQCFVRFLQLFLQNTSNSPHKTLFAYANEIQDWDFINLLLRIPYDFEER